MWGSADAHELTHLEAGRHTDRHTEGARPSPGYKLDLYQWVSSWSFAWRWACSGSIFKQTMIRSGIFKKQNQTNKQVEGAGRPRSKNERVAWKGGEAGTQGKREADTEGSDHVCQLQHRERVGDDQCLLDYQKASCLQEEQFQRTSGRESQKVWAEDRLGMRKCRLFPEQRGWTPREGVTGYKQPGESHKAQSWPNKLTRKQQAELTTLWNLILQEWLALDTFLKELTFRIWAFSMIIHSHSVVMDVLLQYIYMWFYYLMSTITPYL